MVLIRQDEEREANRLHRYVHCIPHEMAHQMAYRSGLQASGVMYPFWISEGLAANFETLEQGFAGPNPDRQRRRMEDYRAGRLADLNEFILHALPPCHDKDASAAAYAQAWGLVRFLYHRDPVAFRRHLYTLACRPHGERPRAALQKEFGNAFGTMETVTRDWERFLHEVSSPPFPLGALAKEETAGVLRPPAVP